MKNKCLIIITVIISIFISNVKVKASNLDLKLVNFYQGFTDKEKTAIGYDSMMTKFIQDKSQYKNYAIFDDGSGGVYFIYTDGNLSLEYDRIADNISYGYIYITSSETFKYVGYYNYVTTQNQFKSYTSQLYSKNYPYLLKQFQYVEINNLRLIDTNTNIQVQQRKTATNFNNNPCQDDFNLVDENNNILTSISSGTKINFDVTKNTYDVNGTEYATSYDINVNVFNLQSNHIFMYQFVNAGSSLTDNWITHTFANNNYNLNLNFDKNGTLYTQILDTSNNYQTVVTKTYTINDILKQEIMYDIAEMCDLKNRNIAKITLDFSKIYSANYTYQYSYDSFNNYIDITSDLIIDTENSVYRYELQEYFNHKIHVRVLDDNSNIVDEKTLTIAFNSLASNLKFTKKYENNKLMYDIDFSYYEDIKEEFSTRYDEFNYVISSHVNTELNYTLNSSNLTDNHYSIEIDSNTNGKIDFAIIVKFKNTVDIEVIRITSSVQTEINDIYNNLLNDDTDSNNFTSIGNMSKQVQNFISHMSEFFRYITDILVYIFQKMNIYVKSLLITFFVLIIFCTIIKIMRK